MVTNSSFSTAQRVSSALPQFNNPSLLRRINWTFAFKAAYLTAGVAYCVHHLYQAYQLTQHTSFGLDDRFKLAKCQALFAEAQEKDFANAKPLLQQCEDLLASIPANKTFSYDKNRFLVELAQYYAAHDPEHSYQMALNLSSSHELLRVARSIKQAPNFDTGRLNDLFVRAYTTTIQEYNQPGCLILSMKQHEMLEFAKIFHSLNNLELSSECMTKALELANAEVNDLARFRAFCQIVRYCKEIGNEDQMRSSIEAVQVLLNDKAVGVDAIEARLNLASIFFFLENFSRMDQELGKVVSLIGENDPLTTVKNLYPLAKLISILRKNEKTQSAFKDFEVEPLIEGALTALGEDRRNPLSATDRVEAYLGIASIYQEKLLNTPAEKNKVLNKALQEIQNLPENTDEEVNSKIDLLMRLSYHCKNDVDTTRQIILSLENFYDRCPGEFDHTSSLRWEKPSFGKQILRLYNKANLQERAAVFFQKYLSDLQKTKRDKDIFNKISRLVTYASHNVGVDGYDNVDQTRAQLKAAEALLSQITSSISYEHACSMIIQGYLQTDRQKGLELLENYENQQARSCVISAIAIPIFMGILHLYPKTAPFLSIGSFAFRLWRGSF